MSRVLIADDHAVVRAGYRQFLEVDRSITYIGEAATGTDALDALRREPWDLLLMDVHMPDRSGLDILGHVTKGFPRVRVLITSGLPEEQYAHNVLRAGASGFLSKGGSADEFLKAVRLVLSGRRYISASLAESLAGETHNPRDPKIPLHGALSSREFQIFCTLAAGVAVSRIAAELSLSIKTVSTYRSRILEKTGFKTNADITAYALRNGLIQ
jgi:two-component system, NarL family, invasion response regulator UvrY